jgi:squalene synthase HpnC
MPAPPFAEQLVAWGPQATPSVPSLADAQAYCRELATSHYENFSVASWLLPKRLRPHFYHIYAYCRWADDLADETGDPARSLELLAWWEELLNRCYEGHAEHPVFVALRSTIETFAIPREPFRDLLTAFRRDQTSVRYKTFDELLEYCRYSANPVGRLVLYLGESYSAANETLSDHICTGLQLANHWQDVARDHARGRIYLPQEDLRRYGVSESMLGSTTAAPQVRDLLREHVERAESELRAGRALVDRVTPDLRWQVDLFVQGGLAILEEIRQQDYDVLHHRPQVSKWRKLRLVAGTWWAAHWRGGNR